jgi:surfactin synthase thioesterase subunit
MRLFCLPYAGGAATLYYRWQSSFPDDIDVCPIEFPGRLTRLAEPPFRQVGPLVRSLSSALDPYLDIPFAFFGYSLGALIAYEWAREVVRRRGLEPVHLIVAARAAPSTRIPNVLTERMSDDDLIARINGLYGARIQTVLSDPEMRAIVLRIMRADLAMLDAYTYKEETMLRAPITVLGGEHDSAVARESLGEWAKHTSGAFSLRMFAGDHFFLHADEPAVIGAVKAVLGGKWEGDRPLATA